MPLFRGEQIYFQHHRHRNTVNITGKTAMAYKYARTWPLKSDNYNWLFSHAIIQRGNKLFSAPSALKHGQHNRQNSNGIQIWSDLPDAPQHIMTPWISGKARASTRMKEYDGAAQCTCNTWTNLKDLKMKGYHRRKQHTYTCKPLRTTQKQNNGHNQLTHTLSS